MIVVDRLYRQLHELQASLPKPTIAAIAGSVRGGGMSMAITCDMLVAAETANFGYPEMEVGLLPAIHYTHLPRIVGRYRAFDLLFTGRVFSAQEALELGLVSRVVPEAQVLEEARKLAHLLAAKSPELMRLGKAAFTRTIDNGYRQGAAGAVDLVSTVFGTDSCREGLAAGARISDPRSSRRQVDDRRFRRAMRPRMPMRWAISGSGGRQCERRRSIPVRRALTAA